MKVKTSVTLPEDLLRIIDRLSAKFKSRSDFIETASRYYISNTIKDEQDKNDLNIINTHAERLNNEASDVLSFQVDL